MIFVFGFYCIHHVKHPFIFIIISLVFQRHNHYLILLNAAYRFKLKIIIIVLSGKGELPCHQRDNSHAARERADGKTARVMRRLSGWTYRRRRR